MRLSHQEYWSGLPFPLPGDLPNPFNLCSKPMRCMLLFAGDLFTIQRSQIIPNINPSKGQFVLSLMIKIFVSKSTSILVVCLCEHARTLSVLSNSLQPPGQLAARCLSIEFSRQEYWSRLPFPIPAVLLTQGSKSCLLCLLHRQMDSLLLHHLGNPLSWLA